MQTLQTFEMSQTRASEPASSILCQAGLPSADMETLAPSDPPFRGQESATFAPPTTIFVASESPCDRF
jgi:hypothetical protein